MSRRFKLNAGEISAILQAAGHNGDGPAFDLKTEEGTKDFARYRMAIAKLRAKLGRIERTNHEQ